MRTRMYGGVGGRKTKVGGKPTFCFPPTRFLFLKCAPNVTHLGLLLFSTRLKTEVPRGNELEGRSHNTAVIYFRFNLDWQV